MTFGTGRKHTANAPHHFFWDPVPDAQKCKNVSDLCQMCWENLQTKFTESDFFPEPKLFPANLTQFNVLILMIQLNTGLDIIQNLTLINASVRTI